MTAAQVHALCAALVATDLVARTLRIRLLTTALGHPVSFRQAFSANAIGDAACAVTPMRLGGEPSRLAGLMAAGVPATAVFVAIAFEVITMWPVTIAAAAVIGWCYAPRWLDETAPALVEGLGRTWSWFVALAVVSLLVFVVVRRRVQVTPRVTRRPWRRVQVYWRRMPAWPLVGAAALSFVNLATRTAILPVLLLLLPEPPALGPAVLGSFALLYSQLALPTPSGMGVVDLGLLAGAAGSMGDSGVTLLVWWRFYTSMVGVALGAWAALRVFGWDVMKRAMLPKSH